jgi:hypothetical protein
MHCPVAPDSSWLPGRAREDKQGMPEGRPAHITRPILERPLCARCISEAGITASDIAAYVRSTAGSFTLNDDIDRCPQCGRAAKVFSVVR